MPRMEKAHMKVSFKTLEYTLEDQFIESKYEFNGDHDNGWIILRNESEYLRLGSGYRLLRTCLCGICSTDLSRRYLPFPLPQIIGHEIVAEDPESGEKFVVEINDTCLARGDNNMDIFCRNELATHCPGRMVLGIDRLREDLLHIYSPL